MELNGWELAFRAPACAEEGELAIGATHHAAMVADRADGVKRIASLPRITDVIRTG
jgi:hypothetical protein